MYKLWVQFSHFINVPVKRCIDVTKGFASNHDKSLQIYFFRVKRHASNDFLKYNKRRVELRDMICNELFQEITP